MSMFTPHSPRSVSLRMMAGAKDSSALSGVAAVSELSVAIRELLGHLQTLAASSVSRGDVFKGKVGDTNIALIEAVIRTIQHNYEGAAQDSLGANRALYDLAIYLSSEDGKKLPCAESVFRKIDAYFAQNPDATQGFETEIGNVEKGAPILRP